MPVLSYALAHNGIAVVSQLVLTGSGAPIRSASVRVGVRDAEGPIGDPVELFADIDPGSTTVLTDVGLRLDPAAMLQVEERRPGWLSVSVEQDGEVLGSARVPVQVLAAAQWLATPLELAMEMLAAHVLPNHPAVPALVAEAAELLREQTGSPSIEGYQSGPDRVDAIVAAICAAVQHRDVRYSEPPASWADLGQKVRTPGEVLDERVGTCLDLVVVLAAALEQAGIRPLLWLVEGHAFLGYWREELSAQSAAITDVASLVNLIDLGLIRLVETTMLTTRTAPAGFDELHRAPYAAWLTGDLDRVIGVTDVYRARSDGVLPLPARTRDADGNVQVIEYRPAVHSTPARPSTAGTTAEPGAAPGRRPAADRAVEERAAGPQPAQPADQLHAARRHRADRARRATGRAGGPGQRRDGADPAAQRPAGRRPEGARAALGPGTAAGPADRTAARPPRAVRRRPARART